MFRFLLLALLVGCSSPAREPAPAPVPKPARLEVVDSAAPFLGWAAHAVDDVPETREVSYAREVAAQFPEYDRLARGLSALSGTKPFASRLDDVLRDWPTLQVEIEQVHARIPGELAQAETQLRTALPDFAPQVEVRQLHSLGSFDGATRVLDHRYFLLFGIDYIARYHGREDLRPFFVHELFHTYVAQKRGKDGRNPHLIESLEEETKERDEPIYASLWDEGLATHVSSWLVPGASLASRMLTVPEDLVARCQADQRRLASALRADLRSKDPAVYGDWFYSRPKRGDRPGRAGYYFGDLIAAKLHQKRSIQELVALGGEPLIAALDTELAELAK